MNTRYNVLFLCNDNATISLMAEAVLNRRGGDEFRAFSAGAHPRREPHPMAVEVLKTHHLWNQGVHCKDYSEFQRVDAPRLDFAITVGERAPADLPRAWSGNPKLMHWRITEPLLQGDSNPALKNFKKTFFELENRIKLFVLVYHTKTKRHTARAA